MTSLDDRSAGHTYGCIYILFQQKLEIERPAKFVCYMNLLFRDLELCPYDLKGRCT